MAKKLNNPLPRTLFTACMLGLFGLGALLGCGQSDRIATGGENTNDAGTVGNGSAEPTPPFDSEGARGDDAGVPAAGESDGFSNPDACFDNADNDGNDAADCNDASCRQRGTCCVGNANCCAPQTGASTVVDFRTCADAEAAKCHPSLARFGDATFTSGGLMFANDLTTSSGLTVGEMLDLRTLQRVVRFDIVANCEDDFCSGTSAVSLVRGDAGAPDARPDVAVGLQAFATTSRVGLVIENTVVASWPMGNSGTESWTLRVSPSGEVAVRGPGVNVQSYVELTRDVFVMVHGQGAGAPLIETLSIDTLICDTPTAWMPATSLRANDGQQVRNPSIAKNDAGEIWVAFERDRRIHFGQLNGSMIDVRTTLANAIRADGYFHSAVEVRDPELLWESGKWTLYFTGVGEDQNETRVGSRGEATVGAIVRARIDPDSFDDDAGYDVVLAPYGHDTMDTQTVRWPGVLDYEMPTITRSENPTYPLAMVVRANLEDGSKSLRAFKSTTGIEWEPITSARLEERTARNGSSSSFRFDAEEITQPSLVVQNRAYHLYYEGRRGERSSIGLLVSDDLLGWRDLSENDAVYQEGKHTFDQLGTHAADVLYDGEVVRMLYVGDSGGDQVPALTQRAAPNFASM